MVSAVMSSTVMTASAKSTEWLHAAKLLERLRSGAILPDVVTIGGASKDIQTARGFGSFPRPKKLPTETFC